MPATSYIPLMYVELYEFYVRPSYGRAPIEKIICNGERYQILIPKVSPAGPGGQTRPRTKEPGPSSSVPFCKPRSTTQTTYAAWLTYVFQLNIAYCFFAFALVMGQFSDPDVLILSMMMVCHCLANLNFFWQLDNLLMEIPPEEVVPQINPPNWFRTFNQLHPHWCWSKTRLQVGSWGSSTCFWCSRWSLWSLKKGIKFLLKKLLFLQCENSKGLHQFGLGQAFWFFKWRCC